MAKTTSNTSTTGKTNPLGQQIGVVKIVSGTVTATGADGVARILKVGDAVYLDDVIKTADLSFIQIALNTGVHFELGRSSEAVLDNSVLQGPLLAQGDTGQAPDVEAIQAAIQAGQDPTQVTPPPAAGAPGAGGPGGDDGHGFVVVNFDDQQGQVNSGFDTTGLGFAAASTLEETSPLIIPPPGISINDVTVNEGAGTASFTVILDAASANTVTVNFTTANGSATAGSDYTAGSGVITFAPGVTSQTITIPVTNDNVFEGTENFFVNLTTPVNGDIVDAQGVGTIIDNEAQPGLSINDVTVNESAGTATFTVTLSGPSAGPVTVDFATANGTATSGLDYTGQTGSLSFAPGVVSQTITVPILNDTIVEGAETYTVNLTNASGASIVDNQGLGTIIDNDVPPPPPPGPIGPAVTFGITVASETDEPGLQAATISEDIATDDQGAFTITRSGDALTGANTASVLVTIGGDTENGAGQDFTTAVIAAIQTGATAAGVTATDNLNGTVTLTWGSTSTASVLVSLEAVNDTLPDSPETLTLTLSALGGAALVSGQTAADLSITEPPPENSAPIALNDSYNGSEDTVLTIPAAGILANDNDPNGDPLTAALVNGPANGSLTFNTDGSFTYTPNANFNGTDSFTYQANDGTANSNVATVAINIAPVNDPPVANNDAYNTAEDTALIVSAAGVLANDTDVEADPLTSPVVSGPANGTLTLNTNGSFTYTPNANFNGTDSFTYQANDGATNSNTAMVTITVGTANDPPLANNDSYSTSEDTALTIPAAGVLVNDTDADGDTLAAILVSGPTSGALTLNSDGSFTYTPNANFNGTDSFTYQANDGTANSTPATVTITVNPVNDPPVATNDSYSTNEDTALTIPAVGVLANDTDVEADPLTASVVSGPANGTLTLNANGSFTYTPNANFNGTDSFTYQANDGTANSTPATVTITVNPVNDPPVATNDSYSTNEDTALTIPAAGVLVNDTDADGNPLTAVVGTGPANGALTLNANGSFTYTPNANFNGTDSFTYQANDGSANSTPATVTITVNPVNDPPMATNDSYTVSQNSVLTIPAAGVLTNDTDVDGNPLTSILVTGPSHGTLTLNSNGSFTYTPSTGYTGPDSFTYKANDSALDSNTAVVNINVAALPTLSIAGVPVTEGDPSDPAIFANFVVTLSAISATDVTVSYATTDGSAKDGVGGETGPGIPDYTGTSSGTLIIPAGSPTGTISIPIINDLVVEGTENFTVTLSSPVGATIAVPTATGNITDDDQVTFNISGTPSVTEGGSATYTINYTGTLAVGQTATVNYATGTAAGGAADATPGTDYTAIASTLLTFTGGGPTSQTVTVNTLDDFLAEPTEDFQVILIPGSNSANSLIGTGSATTNILDNEPTISINDVIQPEGTVGGNITDFTFTVTLSHASTSSVTVHYATANGTATTANSDYQGKSGDITFGVGQTSKDITIKVLKDSITEPHETFFVNLSSPSSNASIADGQGEGRILNDDSINISDATVNEAAGTATFTVSLSNALPHPVTVDFTTADGTATAGNDYLAQTGTLTFASGVTSQTITVPILNDAIFEGNETFTVSLSNASGDTIKDGIGVGTITDDDLPAALNISDLLTGAGPHGGDLGEFLRFDTQTSPGNTLVTLDTDGAGPALNVPLVTLTGMVVHDLSALLSPTPDYTP